MTPNLSAHRWQVFATTAVGHYATVVGNTGIAIGLPRIADDFDLDIAGVSWVMVIMPLTVTAVLLPVGWLSDIAARKSIYLAGLLTMAAGLAVSAMAPNLATLLVGRVIEGTGTAMVTVVAVAIVTAVFPAHERGMALGMIMFVVGFGAVSGPILGGVLIDAFGWRAIFVATGLITVSGAGVALVVLDAGRLGSSDVGSRGRIDWPGIVLSTSGLTSLILALTSGNRLGWGSPFIIGGFSSFAILLTGFVIWERRTVAPMIDLTIFRVREFSWNLTSRFLGFLINGPTNFLMPFYIQDVTGRSATQAGLILAPLSAAMAMVGALAGRLSDRFSYQRLVYMGFVLQIGTLTGLSTLDRSSSVAWITLLVFAHGCGSGLWMAPNMSAAVGAVPRTRHGLTAAFLNVARNAANVISVAVAVAIVAGVMISMGVASDLSAVADSPSGPAADAFVSGMHVTFRVLITMVVLAIVATGLAGRRSGRQRRRDPSAAVSAARLTTNV